MGRKLTTQAFEALNVEMDGSHVGQISTVEYLDRILYFVKWENGVGNDGEIELEITHDGNTWTKLPFAPSLTVDTAAGEAAIQVNDITWKQMRPIFTDNSGGVGAGQLAAVCKASTGGA